MNPSIRTRLFIAASLTLALFLGLTGLVLDRAFKESALSALQDRLQTNIYGILAAAELDDNNVMRIPDIIPDPRFSAIESGLYAHVQHVDGHHHWLSKSALGRKIDYQSSPQIGQQVFEKIVSEEGGSVYSLSYGVGWEDNNGQVQQYIFRVSEDVQVLDKQINNFRESLWVWLSGVAVLLLVVQVAILHWGLTPLRRVARNLADIQAGHSKRLQGNYPREISGLTNNLNSLLDNAQARLQRYRDSLSNLAHSLKTPLAVLRNIAEDSSLPGKWRSTAEQQVTVMNDIVEYQLRRAATFGKNNLAEPVAVKRVVDKVVNALSRVYADKNIATKRIIGNDVMFYGEVGDLYEVIGNLTDNAFKWGRKKIIISAVNEGITSTNNTGLNIIIDDDGQGIAEDSKNLVLRRGHRADQSKDGQGIGLAVAAEIIALYDGQLTIKRSSLGGAKIIIAFT